MAARRLFVSRDRFVILCDAYSVIWLVEYAMIASASIKGKRTRNVGVGIQRKFLKILILLCHSLRLTAFGRICAQHGHRGSACAKARMRRIRNVAIEFGMWRFESSGRSSASTTGGKGRLRASPCHRVRGWPEGGIVSFSEIKNP